MTSTNSTTATTDTTIARRPGRGVLGFAAGLVVAGALAVAMPSGAGETPEPAPAAETPAASGIYALSTEQWAYFVGYQAGRGRPLDLDASFELSESELSYLSLTSPVAGE